ncbi:hypothetical protein IC617_14010 [Neiella sp. HB171785]|uniref:DUF5672 domain-containing protein n=1 Tax=Neiella litorisoli TaxID=2771431 RepID=A0A8J6QJV8_9GAMM|nr:DUF5672 family protein [Neiella litorisoli]MBD1390548.1 hypothetical protein [Neiella litorisoli]
MKNSSAQQLRQRLASQGISKHDIEHSHLTQFYGSLKPFKDKPDMALVDSMGLERIIVNEHESQPLVGLIVETRCLESLVFVVGQVIDKLRIPVQLFHGSENAEFVHSRFADAISSGQLVVCQLNAAALFAPAYNALFLSSAFWDKVIGEDKVLVFQTDALLCSNSDYSIDHFTHFDYIGSKWKRSRPIGMIADGGNGGLSLRSKAKTMDCLQRFPPQQWPGGEDGYFAFHIDLIGGNVASMAEAEKFSTQIHFAKKSFGGHKVSDLSTQELKQFMAYCPELHNILSD